MELTYRKNKNKNLFDNLLTSLSLEKIQNYIPIYTKFFNLNLQNYNSITLNNKYHIQEINEKLEINNSYLCTLEDGTHKRVYIKMAPLLDPIKYLSGEYVKENLDIFTLPCINEVISENKIHPKLLDIDNSAYIEGFFYYLANMLESKFIHTVEYYGSFLGIKNNLDINVADDVDYLMNSDFFNKHIKVLFHSEYLEDIMKDDELSEKSGNRVMNIEIIDEDVSQNIENIIEEPCENIIDDILIENIELIDIIPEESEESIKSEINSLCSSRTSETDETNDDRSEEGQDGSKDSFSESDMESEIEHIKLTINRYPVEISVIEKCENTLDTLLENNISDNELMSALFQIVMILTTYQKCYWLTHNDLHTNNIMFNTTDKKFIFYKHKEITYKIKTYGRIYKIIDYGRSIYKYRNMTFCSSHFQKGEDADTQYNFGTFYNDKLKSIPPNFSFDLTRLGVSIFDYIFEQVDDIKKTIKNRPIAALIHNWCLDDNGKNIIYKTDGTLRYENFKLYKMIARTVHNKVPSEQIKSPQFKNFITKENPLKNTGNSLFVNIDELTPMFV